MMMPKPLSGTTLVEYAGPESDDVTRVSIAFAGRLAADLGADVISVNAGEIDPMESWIPLLPSGKSAISAFLNHAKRIVREIPEGDALLLTNDPEMAENWTKASSVLVRSSLQNDAVHSELTILAASGLLDIFGAAGQPPLPLPGHQAGYAAGISAFNALIASVLGDSIHPDVRQSRVSVVDVATWLNWKHYLACHMNNPEAGIGRPEDWTTTRCRDGYIALVFQDKDVPRLAQMIGNERLNDPAFATVVRRRANIATFNSIVSAWAEKQLRNDIIDQAKQLSIPIGPVLTVADLMTDRQMLARKFIDLTSASPHFGLPRLPATWAAAS